MVKQFLKEYKGNCSPHSPSLHHTTRGPSAAHMSPAPPHTRPQRRPHVPKPHERGLPRQSSPSLAYSRPRECLQARAREYVFSRGGSALARHLRLLLQERPLSCSSTPLESLSIPSAAYTDHGIRAPSPWRQNALVPTHVPFLVTRAGSQLARPQAAFRCS